MAKPHRKRQMVPNPDINMYAQMFYDSDLSMIEFCDIHHLNYWTFRDWYYNISPLNGLVLDKPARVLRLKALKKNKRTEELLAAREAGRITRIRKRGPSGGEWFSNWSIIQVKQHDNVACRPITEMYRGFVNEIIELVKSCVEGQFLEELEILKKILEVLERYGIRFI